jgi:hypothetical protein
MPSTYTLIKGETISSSAATYTFTAIPTTFTDLVIRASVRSDNNSPDLMWRINNNTSSIYSDTQMNLYWTGAAYAVQSVRDNAIDKYRIQYIGEEADSTANTFGNYEWYFPNYLVAQNKAVSFFGSDESNTASANEALTAIGASLALTTTAISEISIFLNTGNWVSGSSFYLYGVKNA